MVFFVLLAIVFLVILLFSSKKLSPIPYFPTQRVDLGKIVKALNLKNNQTVLDLGAGDGIVIFMAADWAIKHKLNTKFIAVEINPVLVLILYLRRLFHPNKNNMKIILGDMFKLDIKISTVYLYISPWFLERVVKNLKLKKGHFRVVSYMYPIKSLKNREKEIRGKNSIFVYDL